MPVLGGKPAFSICPAMFLNRQYLGKALRAFGSTWRKAYCVFDRIVCISASTRGKALSRWLLETPVLWGKRFHFALHCFLVLSRTWGICGKSCWASQYLGSLSVLAVSSSKVRVSTLFETPKNIESQSWNQAELELQVGTFQSWNSGKLELELLHGEKRVQEIRACRFQLSGFHCNPPSSRAGPEAILHALSRLRMRFTSVTLGAQFRELVPQAD